MRFREVWQVKEELDNSNLLGNVAGVGRTTCTGCGSDLFIIEAHSIEDITQDLIYFCFQHEGIKLTYTGNYPNRYL